MSVYALVDPDGAQSRRERVDRRRARRRLRHLPRPRQRPDRVDDRVARRRRSATRRSVRRCSSTACPSCSTIPSASASYWADEDAHLEASEAAIASGEVHDRGARRPRPRDRHRAGELVDRARCTGSPALDAGGAPDRGATTRPTASACSSSAATATSCSTATRPGSSTCPAGRSAGSTSRRSPTSSARSSPATRSWTFDGVDAIAPALHLRRRRAGPASSAIPPERVPRRW